MCLAPARYMYVELVGGWRRLWNDVTMKNLWVGSSQGLKTVALELMKGAKEER